VQQTFAGGCPPGWAAEAGDCDPLDVLTHPNAPELPDDGVVQNCGGQELIPADDNGVFVAKTGDDANPGTMSEPKLTVQAGVGLAETLGRVVYIAGGTYKEEVTTSVSLFGGYDATDWSRSLDPEDVLIAPAWSKGEQRAVIVQATAPVALQTLYLHGGPGGDSTTGVEVDSGDVELVNDRIVGGAPVPSGAWGSSWGVRALAGRLVLVENTVYGGYSSGARDVSSCGVCSWSTAPAVFIGNDLDGGEAYAYDEYGQGNAGAVSHHGPALLRDNAIEAGTAGGNHPHCTASAMALALDDAAVLSGNAITGGLVSASDQANATAIYVGKTAELTANDISGGNVSALEGDAYAVKLYGVSTLADNVIRGGAGGGGLIFSYAVEAFAPTTLVNNTLAIGLAGSYNYGVRPWAGGVLVHNTIIPGDGLDRGPGLYLGGDVTLVNNILNWIFVIGGGTLVLQHNDVWDDAATCLLYNHDSGETIATIEALNACAWAGCNEAAGNISVDPLLLDPANGDYHLDATSLCIDAGVDPAAWYSGELADLDFEGDPRPSGDGWDIGADEYVEKAASR
jgi:hypothetical protein